MSIGTLIVVILVFLLMGGFSGWGGGLFYGTGHYGAAVIGLSLVIALALVMTGRL